MEALQRNSAKDGIQKTKMGGYSKIMLQANKNVSFKAKICVVNPLFPVMHGSESWTLWSNSKVHN